MNPWFFAALLGLSLSIVSLILFAFVYRKNRVLRVSDSKSLREAIRHWEPFVLEHSRTPRAVKRFANQARILATDKHFLRACEQSKELRKLVGLVAVESAGGIDWSEHYESFEELKKGERWGKVESRLPEESKQIINSCEDEDWRRYRELSTGVRIATTVQSDDTVDEHKLGISIRR